MIVGWSKITMSYGEIRGETVVGATPMAVFGACLLLIGGFFLFRRVTKRRTFAEGRLPSAAYSFWQASSCNSRGVTASR
jgi:hypothetical protein